MIRRVALLRRAPLLTKQEFVDHWLEQHAPLARDLPGLRGYRINVIAGEGNETEWDGLGELWFDSAAAAAAAFETAPLSEMVAADLGAFVGERKAFFVEEHVIVPPPEA